MRWTFLYWGTLECVRYNCKPDNFKEKALTAVSLIIKLNC